MGKFAVFSAALRGGETALAIIGILTALVAVFFYLRVVVALYMKSPAGQSEPARRLALSESVALIIPAVVILAFGVYPQPLLDLLSQVMK